LGQKKEISSKVFLLSFYKNGMKFFRVLKNNFHLQAIAPNIMKRTGKKSDFFKQV